MNKAERFTALIRRWLLRDDTGLSVERVMEAVAKRSTEEAAHIIETENGPKLGFIALLIPFSDGSHAAMFVKEDKLPFVAEIEADEFEDAVAYAAKLGAAFAHAKAERAGATIH
jgi:hypothetical protein